MIIFRVGDRVWPTSHGMVELRELMGNGQDSDFLNQAKPWRVKEIVALEGYCQLGPSFTGHPQMLVLVECPHHLLSGSRFVKA